MDKAMQTMIDNLQKNTGRSLEEWTALVARENFAKHGEAMKFLKETHGLTHGYANLVVHKAKGSDAGSATDENALIEKQYKGKETLRPVYERIMESVRGFGNDVEVSPKNAYVSLRRKKQFAMLTPATKTRFEIGINLKGTAPSGRLEANAASNAMCSHKISVTDASEINEEVINFLRKAYENAG